MAKRKQKDPNADNKAIKYRIYPNEQQAILLAKTFGCCRKVWNLMLADKNDYYKEHHETLKITPADYKKQEEYFYLKEVDSLALANVQLNLDKAFSDFFKGLKDGNKVGYPKFKSAKKCRKSYTTNNQDGTIKLLEGSIKLPILKVVKADIHRLPEEDWVIKSATVSQDPDDKYYVSVLFEYIKDVNQPTVHKTSNNALGLDYKSDGLYKDSNGNLGSDHKFFRESQKKLAKAQRKLSRMTYGSKNYLKQQKRVAKIHKKIANQRLDNLQKLSTEIANQYDIVCAESLHMKAIANKGFGNGKATLDNGYGMFLTMLEYKLNDRGKHFVKVDKWYPSSQLCSHCGYQQKLDLSERTYRCPVCGLVIDRDENAAINVLNEGLRILRESA